jgi:hypothetical protein
VRSKLNLNTLNKKDNFMNSISISIFIRLGFIAALLAPAYANAENAMVRITCEDNDKGAEVQVDGKFKGECPVDIMLPEGTHKFRVSKKFDDTQDRLFEQEFRLGGGTSKKIDVVLSPPQPNAAAKRTADAANRERYKQAEASLAKKIQMAGNGDIDAKRDLTDSYTLDSKGCYIYNPLQSADETVTWTGGCRKGLTTGSGELSLFKGGVLSLSYVGVVVAGRQEGYGVLQFKAAERYEGNFEDGFRSGRGIQVLNNGRYEGNFLKGLRDGNGNYYWTNGERYEGAWVRGKRAGNGIHYEPNGMRYEGEFQNDARNGKGTLFWPDGDKWVGNFVNGDQKDGRLIRKGS